jgi:hypothetical protein
MAKDNANEIAKAKGHPTSRRDGPIAMGWYALLAQGGDALLACICSPA